MPLSVLYVWDADYPWDVRTEKICRALTARGYRVHIAARNRRRRAIREILPEGVVHRLAPIRWLPKPLEDLSGFPAFFNPRWLRLIRRAAKEADADVIIVRDLPLCPSAILAARRAGLPVVLDMAENYPAMIRAVWEAGRQKPWDVVVRNPRLVSRVERWCLSRIDRVLVVVEESGQRLTRMGVPREHIALVSNTPPRIRAARAEPVASARHPGAPLEIVYLGLMEIPRGVGELLRATALLLAQNQAVRLTLIGDGRDRPVFEAEARRMGLSEASVRFLGSVPNDEALRLVAAADVGVVPHHADEAWNTTIPNKLFDYMAAGLPVVSSDAAPSKRIVEKTGAGLVYPDRDVAALAGCLASLQDPAVRRRYGEAGRAAILDSLNWEVSVAELDKCLTELAHGHREDSRDPVPSRV